MSKLKEIPELTKLIKEHEPNAFSTDNNGYIMDSFFARRFHELTGEPFKMCKALPEDLQTHLEDIYWRCKSHILKFDLHVMNNEVRNGSFVCDQIWPEEKEDHQWILDNILPYYGIKVEDVAELDYENSGGKTAKEEADRDAAYGEGYKPPYSQNSINFTKFEVGKAAIMIHTAGVNHVLCKLNIPIQACDQAALIYPPNDTYPGLSYYRYPDKKPCLLNTQIEHTVLGLDDITEDRIFLSIALTTPFNTSIAADKVIPIKVTAPGND